MPNDAIHRDTLWLMIFHHHIKPSQNHQSRHKTTSPVTKPPDSQRSNAPLLRKDMRFESVGVRLTLSQEKSSLRKKTGEARVIRSLRYGLNQLSDLDQ